MKEKPVKTAPPVLVLLSIHRSPSLDPSHVVQKVRAAMYHI